MNQPGSRIQQGAQKKSQKEAGHTEKKDIKLEEGTSGVSTGSEKIDAAALAVTEEIAELLANDDIVIALQKFKSDSEEKKIASEFANSHIDFLKQVVEGDYKKQIARSDVEIRDMLSHVNSMLKKRDEYLFSTIITHCPSHYRNIQKKFYAKIKKEEGNKKE